MNNICDLAIVIKIVQKSSKSEIIFLFSKKPLIDIFWTILIISENAPISKCQGYKITIISQKDK